MTTRKGKDDPDEILMDMEVDVNGVVSYPKHEAYTRDSAKKYGYINPRTEDQSPLAFSIKICTDLEQAILTKTKAKKTYRRAENALAKAQAIAVTMGEVEKSIEKAELGKNEFNRKHALTLLADKEQQILLDAEDDLDDAVDQLTICNNRAIQVGLLR